MLVCISGGLADQGRARIEVIRRAVLLADGEANVRTPDFNLNFTTIARDSIELADLVIIDVGGYNSSAMFDVGVAVSLNRPILIISDPAVAVPSSLSRFRMFQFSSVEPLHDVLVRLAAVISDIITTPGAATPESSRRPSAKKVFVSYSHRDVPFLTRLLVHLRPLEHVGLIDLWVDSKIIAGDLWQAEIEKALNDAALAVLLVSADFLASEFIVNRELPRLLRQAEDAGTRILPLVLKPCRFLRDPELRRFQAVNDPARPLAGMNEHDQEATYDSLASTIEHLMGFSVVASA